MKVLLTGGSGFIGKNILESFLNKKFLFIYPNRKELDLTDQKSVDTFFHKNKIDFIIHCATKPGHRNVLDNKNIFFTDMLMFLNLLKYREKVKKIIILSSGAVYNTYFNISGIREENLSSRLIPNDEHGLFRYTSHLLAQKFNNVVELRLFGVFGKYEDYSIRFISNAICKAIFDLPITLNQNRRLSYLFVEDLMSVLDFLLCNPTTYNCYNVVPDENFFLNDIAEMVKKISCKKLPIIISKEGLGLEYTGDNSRLKMEIPDMKFTEFYQSVSKLYSWYLENKKMINRELLLFDK